MRWLAVVALVSCNWAFGVREAKSGDAAVTYFDAPIDGAQSCPPTGTPIQFLPQLHSYLSRNCVGYSTSGAPANVATAQCYDPFGVSDVETGPADGELTPAIGVVSTNPNAYLSAPRLSSDGLTLSALALDYIGSNAIAVFQHDQDGTWTRQADLLVPMVTQIAAISGSTPPPSAHLLARFMTDYGFHEFVSDNAGGWNEVQMFSETDLGVLYPNSPSITTDGLRIVFTAQKVDPPYSSAVYYADREAIDGRFGIATVLDTVPNDIQDAFLSEDCERLYFSGLNSVFYMQRRQN